MQCDRLPYTLPIISFVGGSTQDFAFHAFFHENNAPIDISGCVCRFSIVSYTNRTGEPLVKKTMSTNQDEFESANTLLVTLDPKDTVGLCGKYVYQISIEDPGGAVEIPNQGILYITNNIDKDFITQ